MKATTRPSPADVSLPTLTTEELGQGWAFPGLQARVSTNVKVNFMCQLDGTRVPRLNLIPDELSI